MDAERTAEVTAQVVVDRGRQLLLDEEFARQVMQVWTPVIEKGLYRTAAERVGKAVLRLVGGVVLTFFLLLATKPEWVKGLFK